MRNQVGKEVALRADAQRNQKRVLDAAQQAFALHGFDASYHRIAHIAGVGVGTVYRRYPDRRSLVQAILLDILIELSGDATVALGGKDAWTAFDCFFRKLSDRMYRHAGLSKQLGAEDGKKIEEARMSLVDNIALLCRHAACDLRPGVGWQEVVLLAQAASVDSCGLGAEVTEERRQIAISIMLDGLRSADRR